MWVLFHRNAKTRPVRGGETFVETCPECEQRATFEEVEVTENFGVFFVDLVGDKERAFRCRACHEVFDLKDRGEPKAAAAAPARPPVDVKAELARQEAKRAAEERRRREAAEVKAVRIEDELAELKKRLGK